ncbi:hypothetical protein PSV08DRAFT_353703 [Bipolaris maydis]|nr:hypothetical protein J3E73DRAFT_372683 [Bipolaris maydis]KAJ6269291.1 hypothetical protein PSV08DRAFT_353703 [Bipolaris maydis]KAJ6280105.1 hypothetical protein J3E71DRAFT_344758 [Bipolaris maydis]
MKSIVSVAALVALALADDKFITVPVNDGNTNSSGTPDIGANTFNPCYLACGTLRGDYGKDKVLYPLDDAYKSFIQSYWAAQQSSFSPGCVFKPDTAQDVSAALLIARRAGCPIATKSGGHSVVPGASNIQNGITISLERLNKTTVSADKKSVVLEPGQTWVQVYSKLEKENIQVLGARFGAVGVGGFTLGGGLSYYSSQYGLACDNVISYEVVIASGEIINVSKTSYPDLFWALRGGGSNFGIVTKFTVAAFQANPLLFGGSRIYTEEAFPALIKAFYSVSTNLAKDPKAFQGLSFGYGGAQLGNAAQLDLAYTEPNPNAPILAQYNAIDSKSIVQSSGQNATLAALSTTNSDPDGLRQGSLTWTFKLDQNLISTIKDIFFEEVASIANSTAKSPSISFQDLSATLIQKTTSNGGNPLGLDPADGPLTIALMNLSWSDAADDERIEAFALRVKRRASAAALAAGKATDYIYMNYAGPTQDVIASYGAENKARLLEIASKYDPTGVFQTREPGGFKLEGAPSDKNKQIN